MLEAEWGSSHPIGLVKSTMVDREGNEIPIPTCETCGLGKNMLIGRRAFQWICFGCDGNMSTQEVLTKTFLKNLVI